MRPAFYALAGGGWRDYVTLLHLPYTAWHLSYVVVGGCLADTVSWSRLSLTVVAFFLALGVGAHALDELRSRPLGTAVPAPVLACLAIASVGAACAIGVAVALTFSLWLLVAVATGAFFVPAYNLELFGGRFHTSAWFALAWGAFPLLTGYLACAGTLAMAPLLAAVWAAVLSLAQRRLSTEARRMRRHVVAVEGELHLDDGTSAPVSQEALAGIPEAALRLLALSTVLLAAALVVLRSTAL